MKYCFPKLNFCIVWLGRKTLIQFAQLGHKKIHLARSRGNQYKKKLYKQSRKGQLIKIKFRWSRMYKNQVLYVILRPNNRFKYIKLLFLNS